MIDCLLEVCGGAAGYVAKPVYNLGKIVFTGCYVGNPEFQNKCLGVCADDTPAHTAVKHGEILLGNPCHLAAAGVSELACAPIAAAYNTVSYCCGEGKHKIVVRDCGSSSVCCRIPICPPCCVQNCDGIPNETFSELKDPAHYPHTMYANAAYEDPTGDYCSHDHGNVRRNLRSCVTFCEDLTIGTVRRAAVCATYGTALTVASLIGKCCKGVFSGISIEHDDKQALSPGSSHSATSSYGTADSQVAAQQTPVQQTPAPQRM